MIFLNEYFNTKLSSASVEQKDSAQLLLVHVNGLLNEYMKDTQKQMPINTKTGKKLLLPDEGDRVVR